MKAIKRSDHTINIVGEREEDGVTVLEGVGDLSARRSEGPWGPVVTSHWKPDAEDLAVLNAGGVIELDVVTNQIPPLRVSAVAAEPEENHVRS